MAYWNIKEKLNSALNSENTISFLKNKLNDDGLGLSNSTPNLNRFLKELPKRDNNIKIINKGNRTRINNDIEILGKKILTRTNSVGNSKNITFESFKYEKEDKIDFKNTINVINEKLNFYDYIFLIRIEEEEDKDDKLKACYYYYLFPTENFKIKEVNKINFDNYKKKSLIKQRVLDFSQFY